METGLTYVYVAVQASRVASPKALVAHSFGSGGHTGEMASSGAMTFSQLTPSVTVMNLRTLHERLDDRVMKALRVTCAGKDRSNDE